MTRAACRAAVRTPLFLLVLFCLLPTSTMAFVSPERQSAVEAIAHKHPDLYINDTLVSPAGLEPLLAARLGTELSALGLRAGSGYYDLRAGRWGTLMITRPMIPGSGVGNSLTWTSLGAGSGSSDDEIANAAWTAFRAFLVANRAQLGIDPAELSAQPQVTVHEQGRIVQINVGRSVGGVPVRDSVVSAVLNSGNLVLYGTTRWGNIDVATLPALSRGEARDVISAHTAAVSLNRSISEPELVLVPLANGSSMDYRAVEPGRGYAYRLVWASRVDFDDDHGDWEALVDAHSGELLLFMDQNQYLHRQIKGGVYPVSNDGKLPDGVEYTGWPMPHVNANTARTIFTNSNGLLFNVTGAITTTLDGRYVRIVDNCGAISQNTASGDLDLGASAGTDCTRPAGTGTTGTTHAARTGFYEVNRLQEQARGWLPSNTWLRNRLTANMNINATCNAFWSAGTINFYRRGGGCANTGEIAGVFDHEWGHGMDQNDARSGISSPGEAPADMYTQLRIWDSCIGRGFRENNVQCGGNGDPCIDCTGVRQEDWTKRRSGMPHNIHWILQPAQFPGIAGVTPSGGCGGDDRVLGSPCNEGTHCEGSVMAETFWDLTRRDLQGYGGSAFNYDLHTVHALVSRLMYIGGGNVSSWFSCAFADGFGGCGATSGYMQFLTVDDDNGNLNDGTPHMTAIFSAFNRHQMACSTPAAVNSGCAARPTVAPRVTVTPQQHGATISWEAVPGAVNYWLFKVDGANGCNAGKERIYTGPATSFVDNSLVNGREFFYSVTAVGSSDSCQGPSSVCVSVVPGQAPTAADQSVTTDEDTAVTVTLSGSDIDSGALTFSIVNSTTNGELSSVGPVTCTPNVDGSNCTAQVTYTPAAEFSGNDSFTFRVQDGSLFSNVASVSITVATVHDAPSATDVDATGTEDTSTTVTLHGSDVDSASLTFTILSGPSSGTVTPQEISCQTAASGSCSVDVVYTPAPDSFGTDSFTYQVSDGDQTDVATATITVAPVNDAPLAAAAGASVETGNSVAITLAASDIDNGSVTFSIVSGPTSGTVGPITGTTCDQSGAGATCTATVTYTPNAAYDGFDQFTFKVNDGAADSNLAPVSIRVTRAGKISGSGQIIDAGQLASFDFNVARRADGLMSGTLQYTSPGRNLTVSSVTVTEVNISGNTGTFSGTCTKNGTPCTFAVTVQDNGEPGITDRFAIEVSGEQPAGTSGPIASGNIRIHKP